MYKKMSAFVVFLVAFLNVNPVLGNLTCLSCIGIFQPRHCHSVAGCTNDEVCGVESVTLNGQILYNLGCRRREQCHSFSNGTSTQSHVSHPCAECCDHTLCNAAGCGQIGYPTVRGPMCYNCPLTDDHRKCHGITSCATDEECYIESKEEFSDMIYSSGCKLKQNCGTGDILSPIIGRRRRGERRDITGGHGGLPTCSNCCTGDLCNRQCGIQNPSACTPNPCLHGSCADDVNGYSCSCEPGYTGPDCQIDIDDCQSSPCVHGTCVDGINNYTCNCPSGFHGDLCETDIDDCQASPCVHGTCVDGINNYTCNCPSGFHGDLCETDFDDCQSSPCVHGACVDGINNYTCNCPYGFHGDLCETGTIRDCVSILKDNRHATSGVYRVQVPDSGQLQDVSVYCDMDTAGGGWTVFQKRYDGSVNFTRNFSEYENGFGDVHGEFWLGLKWLHLMTSKGHCDLRIDMVTDDGNPKYAHYTTFSVGIPTNYNLHIGNFDGNVDDGMSDHDGMSFSTFDHDRDRYSGNCAKKFLGGYWYKYCYHANLNGVYVNSATGVSKIRWLFRLVYHDLAMTEMKLRCD